MATLDLNSGATAAVLDEVDITELSVIGEIPPLLDGVLVLVCVYRRATDTSDLVILDGNDIERAPVATVRLPRRIPAGFHGAWLANDR